MIRLKLDDRRAAWALYQSYEGTLRGEGVHDFHDIVLLAEGALRRKPWKGYSAVIVDEAQDVSPSMVRMLHSLVGDGPDAFTLIGDCQQSIYPGGYVLSEAGIALAGRGVVQDINYRNTVEIQEFANRLIVASEYTDIDDDAPGATVPADVPDAGVRPSRHGPTPQLESFPTRAARDQALVSRVRSAAATAGLSLGDIAVLCCWQAKEANKLLTAAKIQCLDLPDYEGISPDAVKVGTLERAKGLEFKAVLLPCSRVPRSCTSDDERAARELRERYIAATRAR